MLAHINIKKKKKDHKPMTGKIKKEEKERANKMMNSKYWINY